MNIEQDALLSSILDAPEDDAPRLVYADWLDENGSPEMAEFIRVQIELSNHEIGHCRNPIIVGERRCGYCDWCRLWNRQADLFGMTTGGNGYGRNKDWVFFPWAKVGISTWLSEELWVRNGGALVRRGFVDRIRVTMNEFCKSAKTLSGHPITRVAITDREPGQFGNSKRWYWAEVTPDTTYPLHTLPAAIIDLADGRLVMGGHHNGRRVDLRTVKDWDTREAAVEALSRAAVAYIRSFRAGNGQESP